MSNNDNIFSNKVTQLKKIVKILLFASSARAYLKTRKSADAVYKIPGILKLGYIAKWFYLQKQLDGIPVCFFSAAFREGGGGGGGCRLKI